MKKLLFVSLFLISACGTEESETKAPDLGLIGKVAPIYCPNYCLTANSEDGVLLTGEVPQCVPAMAEKSCCQYQSLPFYRECPSE